MVSVRLGTSSRILESVFSHASKQASGSQRCQFQQRIASHFQNNSLITSRSPCNSQSALLPFSQVRHASHASQGTANKHSESSPGRRLGAKKTGDQYVIRGNIIFRQRGTQWFPGENVGMGRDHTIYAMERGYVKFYKHPERHPTRSFIGVALNKEDTLPYPKNAPSKRRLGLIAVPRQIQSGTETGEAELKTPGSSPVKVKLVGSKSPDSTHRSGYSMREANWEIGRAAEKANIRVKEWKRKDRWTAWKKKLEKVKRVSKMEELKRKKKGAKKAAKAARK